MTVAEQERAAAFRLGFLTKLSELGIRPSVFFERVKRADISDLISSAVGGTMGLGQQTLSRGADLLSDAAGTAGHLSYLLPIAAGGLTGTASALLNAPSVEDIEALRKSEIASTYERLAQQIRERIRRKAAI